MSISSVDSGPLHVKPEVDLNLATEANRILYVLNKIVDRVQFVGLLQHFIKDDAYLLRDVLDPHVHLEVAQRGKRYDNTETGLLSGSERRLSLQSFDNMGGMSDDIRDVDNDSTADDLVDDDVDDASVSLDVYNKSRESSNEQSQKIKAETNRKFDDLSELIYILEGNPEVRKMAKSMKNKLSPEMKFFIKTLKEFRDYMQKSLTENATQYKTREKYLMETYQKNERAKKEIERLEGELLVTRTDANVCLIGRNILIKRHQNKIEKIQQNSQEMIEKRVNESEKEMVNSWKTSSAKQEVLNNDLQQTSEKYSNLLKEHLAAEKALRAKRSKVENQVLGWIQKFDQDIGEKQAEEEQIQALLDSELNEVNEIQAKLDEQEEEYDELMQEKAQYEEEMLERRMYQFIINRSARRIQRTFRQYKAQKLAKKLAKKAKKGKKKK